MEKSNQIETKTFKLSSTGIQLHLPLWNRCVPVILVINFLISSDIGYEIRDDFPQRITPIRQIWEIWQERPSSDEYSRASCIKEYRQCKPSWEVLLT